MLWYSFEQLKNYICCRTVSFICKIFPCIQKEVNYHSTLTCRDKHFESPFLGFLWVILTDSTLFCFCTNHCVHLLSELVLVLWPCYFPNCCQNRTYIENFVTFISWFILCSNVNNMDIFSQLLNLFIRHNMNNFRIAGLSCPVQIVIWKFHYTHQYMHAKELLYLFGTSGDIFTLLLYTVQMFLLYKSLRNVVGPE